MEPARTVRPHYVTNVISGSGQAGDLGGLPCHRSKWVEARLLGAAALDARDQWAGPWIFNRFHGIYVRAAPTYAPLAARLGFVEITECTDGLRRFPQTNTQRRERPVIRTPRRGKQCMKYRQNTWALVLAAGDGTRLASLTTDSHGIAVPKQFCSLNGGNSLLQEALQRAQRIVPNRRVCAIVARNHEPYWRRALWSLPTANVIVQPRNCGTANGMLLGVLRILARDPHAHILFLPSDHHVLDETSLTDSLCAAAALLRRGREGLLPNHLLLVGIAPNEPDPELGYIVPGARIGERISRVTHFVEKPTATEARDLIARGAVWSSFIFAAHGAAVVAAIRERYPEIVEGMTTALTRDAFRGNDARELDAFYERLPTVDFSRSIVQGAESSLCLLTVPACGWTDLGTPGRVATALQRLWIAPWRRPLLDMRHVPGAVNLATQYERARNSLRRPPVVSAEIGEGSIAL
jgi:mannose-1-phosphate guanylyltransferase